MKLRLFVAIELNDAVRALAQHAAALLSRAGVTGRYELVSKLHVTVAFLGSTPEAELEPARDALRRCSDQTMPFTIDFDRLGAFPNARRPHVIWLGSTLEVPQFADCARRVREAYGRLGYAFDHDPAAHVTVCRPKHVRLRELPALDEGARLEVKGLTLFQSLPAGQTTRYEAIERARFPA